MHDLGVSAGPVVTQLWAKATPGTAKLTIAIAINFFMTTSAK
jgi:hypothetical protein